MLFELAIIPVGGNAHTSDVIAEVLKVIDDSGLPYELTPAATCIEGEWDQVMAVVRRCHDTARRHCSHLVTTLKIEDEADARDKLTRNVAIVEEKVGRPLRRIHAATAAAR